MHKRVGTRESMILRFNDQLNKDITALMEEAGEVNKEVNVSSTLCSNE